MGNLRAAMMAGITALAIQGTAGAQVVAFDTILEGQPFGISSLLGGDQTNGRQFRQRFTPSISGQLNTIDIARLDALNDAGPLRIELRSGVTTLLGSVVMPFAEVQAQGDFVRVDFTSQSIQLQAGTEYSILLRQEIPSATSGFNLILWVPDDPQPLGEISLNNGASFAPVVPDSIVQLRALVNGPTYHQKLTGDPSVFEDRGHAVFDLSGGGELLALGESNSFDGQTFTSMQSVTRLTSEGEAVWSRNFEFGAQEDRALDMVRAEGDFYVAGTSRRRSTFQPGTDFIDRLTIMRLDDDGNLIWANRYPGGGLPPNLSSTWDELDQSAALCLAPPPDGGGDDSRGTGPMELVVASFNNDASGDPTYGQFMRVNMSGTMTRLVHYLPPAALEGMSMAFLDVARGSSPDDIVVGGAIFIRDPRSNQFSTWPVVMHLNEQGLPIAAWYLPLTPPDPEASGLGDALILSVLVGPNDETYIAGLFEYAIGFTIQQSAFVARIDSLTGQIAWINQIDGFSLDARSLSLNARGELCISGQIAQGPSTPPGEGIVVLESATGAFSFGRQYRFSGGGQIFHSTATSADGWQLIGRGIASGFQSASTMDRGSGNPASTDLLLIRTDDLGRTTCRDEAYSPTVRDLGLQNATAFVPVVNLPLRTTEALLLTPMDVAMDCEDECAYVPCPCFSDASGDSMTDFTDLTTALANWLNDYGQGLTGPGDADCNSVVNFVDITTILGNWLNNCLMGP